MKRNVDNNIEKKVENESEIMMTTNFDNLTDEQIEILMEKYNLKKSNKISTETTSFQVIRSRAIRRAVKSIASRHNVVQKQVHLYDTHKTSKVEYLILLSCGKEKYIVSVDITNIEEPIVKSIMSTDKKSF